MSGQHVGDGAVAAGSNNGDRSPVDAKSITAIAKQHSYEQIDHAHYLANDIGTLYLNDRLDFIIIFHFFYHYLLFENYNLNIKYLCFDFQLIHDFIHMFKELLMYLNKRICFTHVLVHTHD